MKSVKEPWTLKERFGTFMNTPHEGHAIMDGFFAGFGEGHRASMPEKYEDESHYYALGWSIGEIIDRITNPDPVDTKVALAQIAGRLVKYAIIVAFSVGTVSIL